MATFSLTTPNAESTQRVGRALAAELLPGQCVALAGELGAGKTCFVRGMAAGLGCDVDSVSSPTYTLMQRYRGTALDLVHLDAYRLHHPDELRDAGFDPTDVTSVSAVEWPQRAAEALPVSQIHVQFTITGETDRLIEVTDAHGTLAQRLQAALGPRPCPSCKTSVESFATHWPFCSTRCREVDLGRWFSGQYQISRPLHERDLDEQS